MAQNIFTIGYEGASIEDFIETLTTLNIKQLVDIRDYPISRKRFFSKNILAQILERMGIEYIHLKGLGDPKEGRDAARSGNYEKFLEIFHSHLETEVAQEDLERAIEIVQGDLSCLLCYERDHKQCHRTIVAERISEATGQKIKPVGVKKGISKNNLEDFSSTFSYA